MPAILREEDLAVQEVQPDREGAAFGGGEGVGGMMSPLSVLVLPFSFLCLISTR